VLALAIVLATQMSAAGQASLRIDGQVTDALFVKRQSGDEIWLSVTRGASRKLVVIEAATQKQRVVKDVPASAVFMDACPQQSGDDRVVLADAKGIVDVEGARLLEGVTLFSVPDPEALLTGDLCGKEGEGRGELRVPVVEGLRVGREGAPARTLQLKHGARAYSGRVHRGFRPDRGYAEALSLYGPRLFDVDIDADGDRDLVALREGRLVAWRRAPGGLEAAPAAELDLGKKLGAGDADLRVRIVDVDGDARADALVGVTRGAVPEKSEAWLVQSTTTQAFSSVAGLWRQDGLRAPLELRRKTRALVVAEVDTSLVSLSAVVLTGRLPLRVRVGERGAALETQAKVDVRAGRMEGAMPVVSVDFDADGIEDLVELGEPGRARLYKGAKDGFVPDAVIEWDVPRYEQVVPMPALPGVVLIGAGGRVTSVMVLKK
jgi:FG-GAP-like repeat